MEEVAIKYTTTTLRDMRAADDPASEITLADAEDKVKELFAGEVGVIDNTPDIITIDQKKFDGVKSKLDLGEDIAYIQLETGAVYRRYVFTPMKGAHGADSDMSKLNALVRSLRRPAS